MDEKISLFELNRKIRELVRGSLPDTLWVTAEISEMNVNASGHCYLELVEKDPASDKLKARARAIIWSSAFRMLKPYFETTTFRMLEAGLSILVRCQVEFHEVYGFSLIILDIDPAYTLGELARKRQEIIKRLEDEGVIHMNRELPLTLVPQKIAIISSASAAGYGDFIRHLATNEYRFLFYHKLFAAIMQSTEAEASIIAALDRIFAYEDFFDEVVIIRGGGSQADLSCFDSYPLAYHITQFPLPVIAGIGHEKNESVTDIVAHTSLKTPTAVADFIISRCLSFSSRLEKAQGQIVKAAESRIRTRKLQLHNILLDFIRIVQQYNLKSQNRMNQYGERIIHRAQGFLRSKTETIGGIITGTRLMVKNRLALHGLDLARKAQSAPILTRNALVRQRKRLDVFEKTAEYLNPVKVLKRGYSITMARGKIVKSARQLAPGDLLQTTYYKGKSESRVEKTK